MRPARGCSFVELTVVIGIVVFLTGLTLSAGTVVVRHGEQSETKIVLRLLDAAVGEWELQADRRLTWSEASAHPQPAPGAGAAATTGRSPRATWA